MLVLNMICAQCNKEFIKTGKNQKYCSKECYKKSDTFNKSRKKYRQSDKGKEAHKKYDQTNRGKEKIKVAQKKHKQSEKGKETLKAYRQSGKDKAAKNKYQYSDRGRSVKNKYEKERRKIDPIYKLKVNMRRRLHHFYKSKNRKKTNSTFKLVGCTPEFLKEHLEKQFYPHPTTNESMSWKNNTINGWHVDHIDPLDLAITQEDVEKLMYYTNLRPLWADENRKKVIR